VDATNILYFIPFVYMYLAAMKLSFREDRSANSRAVLVPGGKVGVFVTAGLGLIVVVAGIFLSFIPPEESASKIVFAVKLVAGTLLSIMFGLTLYARGWLKKRATRQA